jgi:hypothetical protein
VAGFFAWVLSGMPGGCQIANRCVSTIATRKSERRGGGKRDQI